MAARRKRARKKAARKKTARKPAAAPAPEPQQEEPPVGEKKFLRDAAPSPGRDPFLWARALVAYPDLEETHRPLLENFVRTQERIEKSEGQLDDHGYMIESGGREGLKRNPAVRELQQWTAQLTTLIVQLGGTPKAAMEQAREAARADREAAKAEKEAAKAEAEKRERENEGPLARSQREMQERKVEQKQFDAEREANGGSGA